MAYTKEELIRMKRNLGIYVAPDTSPILQKAKEQAMDLIVKLSHHEKTQAQFRLKEFIVFLEENNIEYDENDMRGLNKLSMDYKDDFKEHYTNKYENNRDLWAENYYTVIVDNYFTIKKLVGPEYCRISE